MDKIQEFISKHTSGDKVKDSIKVFETVRDFLYQINGARTAEEIVTCKEGYCVSKHRLLKEIYEKMGYVAKLCFVPFTFDMAYLPDDLKDWGLANKKGYHVFLKLLIDKNEVNIDATYNKELKDFYVVNENRDGISNQNIVCKYEEIYIPQNPNEELQIKKKLSDPEGFNENDYKWINKYNQWIRDISFT